MARPDHDLLFAYDFPPAGGGIARWMEALARGYPPDTLTVSTGMMAGAAAADAALPQRIDRIPVPASRLRTVPGLFAWSRRGAALARDSAVRFAWCDTIRPAGYVARSVFGRTGLPYGIMVVGNDLLTLRPKMAQSAFKRRVMHAVLGRAAVFVAISEWTAARCRTLLGEMNLTAAASRVRVVPLGTDPTRWRADPEAAAALRRAHRLPGGRWLVTVARLVDYKGIDDAIRAVAALAPRYVALHYAVVGRGPYEQPLRDLALALGVQDRVHFLADVADAELPAAYSLGEIYVGPTRETALDVEGFGISFAEAAACGLPVVAARTGGIPDAVADGVTGLLAEAGNTAAIAGAIQLLLDEPVRARAMGAAGLARVHDYLNWDRVVRDMRAISAEFGRPRI